MYAEHSLLHLLWWKSPENACQVTSLHKRGNKTVPGKYVFMRCANILRKTLCMIFCLEMFTYMFN